MSRISRFLLILTIGFSTLQMSAQESITVANNPENVVTNEFVPIYGFYVDAFLRSQTIYPSPMLTSLVGNTITSMTFYLSSVPNTDWETSFKFQLGTTTNPTFSSINGFLSDDELTEVYSGTVVIDDYQMTINFTTPFNYTGGNLLLDVQKNDSEGEYAQAFFYGMTVNAASLQGYSYQNVNAIQPSHQSFVPKTTFTYTSGTITCIPPRELAISNINANGATLSWTALEGQNEWEVYCGTGEVDLDTVTWTTVTTDTFYTFTELQDNTSYTAYIRTSCDNEHSLAIHKQFMTSLITVDVPFTCTFEDPLFNTLWAIRNGNETNKWYIGSGANTPDGGNALYISDDNGASNTYRNDMSSAVWAFMDVIFPNANEFLLSFDWKAAGERSGQNNYDYLKVFIGTPSNVVAGDNSIPTAATEIGFYNLQSQWQTTNELLPGSYSNSTQRIYFLWRNDYSAGYNPPAAIDNLSITTISCYRPDSVVIHNITSTSAAIDIITTDNNQHAWEIKLVNSENDSTIIITTNNNIDNFINTLSPSSFYKVYVRTFCGEDDYSAWSDAYNFHTDCATALNIPQTWGFESDWIPNNVFGQNNQAPLCWSVYDGGTINLYFSTPWNWQHATVGGHNSGGHAVCYTDYADEPHNDWLITPQMALTGTQMLSFYAQRSTNSTQEPDEISIWISDEDIVLTAPSDSSEALPHFTQIYQTDIPQGDYQFYEVSLSGYSGNRYIAFVRRNEPYDGYNLRLDDVTIDELPSCERPHNPYISNVSSSEANLNWSSSENSFNIYMKTNGTDDYTLVNSSPVSDTSYLLTSLTTNTQYTVYVATVCENQEIVSNQEITFTTLCEPFVVTNSSAFSENFNTLTEGIPDCWSNSEGTTITNSFKWNAYPNEGNGACLRFDSYNNPLGNTNMLKTPPMDLSALTQPVLSFSYKNPAGGDFSVFLSTNGGINYSTIIDTGLTSNDWTEVEYVLPELTDANNVVIVFKGTSNYGFSGAYLYLDNVIVGEMTTCTKPNQFVINEVTSTSVSLSWTELGSATSWNVAYGPAGFLFSDNPTIIPVEDTTISISNLTSGQNYDFYVQANCGDQVSQWRGAVSAIPGSYTFGVGEGSDTISACDIILYDNGGPNNNYSSNCNYSLTVYPSDPDSVVSVSGIFTGEDSWDYLNIYDGSSTEGELLLTVTSVMYGEASGTQVHFGPVTSERGPLTLLFHSDYSTEYDGFEINVSCVAAPDCRKPLDLITDHIAPDHAIIEWTGNENSSYNVALSTVANFDPDTCTNLFLARTNSYSFTNLTNNTQYYMAVQTDCGDEGVSAWSNIHSFITSTIVASVPYFHDFEDVTENTHWHLLNGTETNKWHIGQPTGENNTVLFVSQDGTTAGYNPDSTSSVWVYRDFSFGDGTEFSLSFNWKAYGESSNSSYGVINYDYLQVYIGNPGFVFAGSITAPSDAVQLGNTLTSQDSWQQFHVSLDSSYSNTTKRIYFLWHNDYSFGTDPAAVIDSISISVSECPHPQVLTLTNVEENSATISFTRNDASENAWQYLFGPGNFSPNSYIPQDINDTVIELTGLTASTEYSIYVRTSCGNGNYSAWSNILTFRTACATISHLPFIENFDTYGTGNDAYPLCWDRLNTYSSPRPIINYSSYQGEGALYFYAGSGTYNMAITPAFSSSININSLQATFMYRATYDGDKLIVGVISDPSNFNTFIPVDTVYPDAIVNNWVEREVNFSQYSGSGRYIAFLNKYHSNYAYAYIDNLSIDIIPTCFKPTLLTTTATTTNSITLSWTPGGEEDNWNIEYGLEGFTQGTGTILTDVTNPITISGLASSETYDFYVQSVCNANTVSNWTTVHSAATDCDVISLLPYSENFDHLLSGNSNAFPACWSRPIQFDGFPHAVTTQFHSSPASLRFQSLTTVPTTAATTPLAEDIHNLQVTFWLKAESNIHSGTFEIGVMSDPNNVATFRRIRVLQPKTTWTEYTISFDTTNASGVHKSIAFRQHSNQDNWYYWLDDVTIRMNESLIPQVTDPIVTTDSATAIEQNIATLNATITNPDNVPITAQGFEWKKNGDSYTQIAGTGTDSTFSANLTNLTANTAYTFKAFICFNNDTVYGDELVFVTLEEIVLPCETPQNLSISAITHNTADVTWTAGDSETSWNLQYKTGNDNWTSITVNNTPTYQLLDLIPETTYQVRVQAQCEDTTSEWTEAVSFTTEAVPVEPCDAPTDLTATNVTTNSATLSWTAGGSESSWKVSYKLDTETDWQDEVTVQQPTYLLNNLAANTAYNVYVKAVCTEDNESDATEANFTTEGVGIDNITLSNSISLTPNPADNHIELRINSHINVKEATVYNAFGQMIQTVKLTDNHARIDLSDMAAGMYFIRVNSDNTTATKKFIRK